MTRRWNRWNFASPRFSRFSATLFIARSFMLALPRFRSFESAIYWLIESKHRELARHHRSTCCALQISCLVSLSRLRLRDVQRSAGIALERSQTWGLDTCGSTMPRCKLIGRRCGCLTVRCQSAYLQEEAASRYPSWNLNINSVSNVGRVWIRLRARHTL